VTKQTEQERQHKIYLSIVRLESERLTKEHYKKHNPLMPFAEPLYGMKQIKWDLDIAMRISIKKIAEDIRSNNYAPY